MKLIINEKHIKRNKTIGNTLSFASLGVLGLGLYLAWTGTGDLTKTIYSYLCLIIGFIMTRFGIFFMSTYGQSPRYDEILKQSFEKLRNEYTYYVYSSPVPLLLAGPCRLWLPILVTSTGNISYSDGKWKHTGVNFIKRMMGQETLINPEKDVADASAALQKHLAEKGIPYENQPEIQPVLVILLQKTIIGDVSEAPYPVIPITELKRFIRRKDREECENPISPEDSAALIAALETGKKE
ncbi:MAG: hypothetical protein PHT43_07790 [Anaerolineaceae bacterium]|jgi:hypothetical protein|nr:hypothetical protein [Anaerolineaceae bacterium]